MGAGIHLFIEYQIKSRDDGRWWSFADRIALERDYQVFEKLAGVRGEVANAVVAPRGFPADASHQAVDDNFLWINYSGGTTGDYSCSPKDAELWVASGKSKYFGVVTKIKLAVDLRGEKEPELVDVRRPERVSQPDWHSHSWLSVDEFASAIQVSGRGSPKTYAACLAAMLSLEKNGCNVRAVFWFDN